MAVRALTSGYVPAGYQADVRNAAARALRAGARAPLEYIGIGMTGVVFCDARGRGFKVGRRDTPTNRKMLSEEAEWLATATTVPEIRANVPRFYRYHRRLNVIERECLRAQDRRGRYHTPRLDRHELHQRIDRAMRRHGWSAPEFKDDSYVFSPGRGLVLVDASMPHRVGRRLAARAAEALRGTRFFDESPSDIAWALRMEAGKSLPADFAHRMSDRLLSLPHAEERSQTGEARDARRRDPQLDKKRLWKDIDAEERRRQREKVKQLRARANESRRLRRLAREKAREKCRADRARARRAAARIRARADERATARLEQARQSCQLGKAYAAQALEEVRTAGGALREERQRQRELRAIERSARSRTSSRVRSLAKARGGYFAREARGESDDEVRQNIAPEYHALFERVKRSIKGGSRMSRTEAFMKYVEEHPREADEAIEDQTEALIRQLERRQRTGT